MSEKIRKILEIIIGSETGAIFDVFVPSETNFGHYSTNIALRLAKTQKKNPMDIANEFVGKIRESAPKEFFEKVEVAPPGFINFRLSREAIQDEFMDILEKLDNFGRSKLGKGKKIIVEYSQPNIAKKLHVGHLRTTIIGDALGNILDFLGYEVVRWNYLGDWGTQFGKLIAAYRLWGDKKAIEANPIDELQKLYVSFHDEMKKDSRLEALGQEEFKKLEEGDGENRKLWEWFREESLKEFEKLYATLGVKFDTYIGESFYEKDIRGIVDGLLNAGIAEKSEGAIVVKLDKFGLPPALVQKSDGASLYLTRDIANLEYRLKNYSPLKILYVVGNEQSLHFEQLFAVAKTLGLDEAELLHVKYGLVLGEDSKKFATREGRVVLLDDILKKAISLARDIVEEKNGELATQEKDEIALAVGVGALKYNDLKENRTSDISFNWKTMLDLKGDSAPYLQYTYARLRSVLRKANDKSRMDDADKKNLNKETELTLIRKILEFPDEVLQSGKTLQTSNLASYLYKLASLASRFYEEVPVIKEKNDSRRKALVALVDVASSVLKKGLGLLGIRAPEEI